MDSGADRSDDALLARIAAGNREAFSAVFARYAPRVKSYLLRLGAPGAIAEDLAQDAMLSVWRRAADKTVKPRTRRQSSSNDPHKRAADDAEPGIDRAGLSPSPVGGRKSTDFNISGRAARRRQRPAWRQ